MAGSTLSAVKLGIKVAHLEAGLRSFDRTMPEEINRIVTDSIANYLWTPSPDADRNLNRDGIAPEKISKEPLGYKAFMNLIFGCKFVITDSGGIQEETTYLKIPCLTLRPNTERPVTIIQGTNKLSTPERIEADLS